MPRYDQISQLSREDFRRLTGVLPETFEKMSEILRRHLVKEASQHKHRGGRKPCLCPEDMLLVTLEYLREYRSMFHIAGSYGVGESTVRRTIRTVEDVLVKDGTFSLPGRKALVKSDVEYTLVVVDATESPIERPKKGSDASARERRSAIRSNNS